MPTPESFVAVLHGTIIDLPTSVRLHKLCEGKTPWRDLRERVASDPKDEGLRREAEKEGFRISDDVFRALAAMKVALALPDSVLSFRPITPAEADKSSPEPAERATPAPPEPPVAKTIANSLPSERGPVRSGSVVGPRPW